MHPVALWLSSAVAAEPSPARLCADAAAGTEIEVCLRLAATHPDAVDEIAAALVAHVDRVEAADRELLDDLLLLSGPGGAEGARRLAELGDPRAVPVLLHAGVHREQAVAVAAAEALARWPEAWPALGRWLVDPELPDAVRLAAGRALAGTGDERAAALIEDALRRPALRRQVREELAEVLDSAFPDRERGRRAVGGAGELWLATGAGAGLGYAMAAAGYFGRNELWPVGAVTGATAGASFGWVYGRAWPMTAGDASLIAIAGAGGAASGGLVGFGLGDTDGAVVGGLIGEAVGFTAGAALRGPHRGTARDNLEAATFALLAAGASEGLLAGSETRRLADGAALGGALVLGLAAAPVLEPGPEDVGLVLTTSAVGLAAGLVLPPEDRLPLALGATAAGGALGLALADPVDLPAGVWSSAATGGLVGASIGGGVGLLAAEPEPLALGFGALGAGVGGWLGHTDSDPVDDRDVALGLAATAWAGTQAAAVGTALDAPVEQTAGAVLVASGTSAAVAASLNLELDVPVPHTLSASSVGLWGAYAGGAAGELASVDPRLTGVVGANVGLLAGGILVSDVVGVPPLVIGIADAGGVLGASTAGLVAAWFAEGADPVIAASLGGALAGATSGAVLGTAWHRSGTRRDIALRLPGRWSVVPLPRGVAVRVDGW